MLDQRSGRWRAARDAVVHRPTDGAAVIGAANGRIGTAEAVGDRLQRRLVLPDGRDFAQSEGAVAVSAADFVLSGEIQRVIGLLPGGDLDRRAAEIAAAVGIADRQAGIQRDR